MGKNPRILLFVFAFSFASVVICSFSQTTKNIIISAEATVHLIVDAEVDSWFVE
jgi:hypothetical protein